MLHGLVAKRPKYAVAQAAISQLNRGGRNATNEMMETTTNSPA